MSSLVGLASRAGELAQARGYGRDAGDVNECLSLLRKVPSLVGAILDEPGRTDDARETFDRPDALRAGRALAQGILVALHGAWREGQGSEFKTSRRSAALSRLLSASERTYRLQLLTSRSACRRQHSARLQSLLEEVVDGAFQTLVPLTRHVAALPPEDRDRGALGMRVARLGRRAAFLAASLLLLRARLSSSRTVNTTAEIARSRGKLCRSDVRLRTAARSLRSAATGSRTRMRGRVREVTWIARPTIPYTRVRLHGTDTEVHVHYKNLQRLGIQAGMAIWVAGKVEEVSGARALVAEFEGPGQHAGEVWEDWLADEVRSACDLSPEVLNMEWDYPPGGGTHVSADVRARLGRRRREEA